MYLLTHPLRDKKPADFVKSYDTGINELMDAIHSHSETAMIDERSANIPSADRITELPIGGVPTPCFFPSISGSAKNRLSPLEHLKIITTLAHPLFLISAYDIKNPMTSDTGDSERTRKERQSIRRQIERAHDHGQIILLDSGIYEKRWLNVKWTKPNFREVLRNTDCHIALSFDTPDPSGTVNEIVSKIVKGVALDKQKGNMDFVCPIIHVQDPEYFSTISVELVQKISPPLIAIPERELGDGVMAIAKNLLKVREALNRTGIYYPIHVLGCGNPLSILIYAACGADSFDGLDWCQTVVDHSTGHLHHSLQLDFFAHQSLFGTDTELPYLTRVLAHNLEFYRGWMSRIQTQLRNGTIIEMIRDFLPEEIVVSLKEIVPGQDQ